MFLRILRASFLILLEKFEQGDAAMFFIPAVNPFIGDLQKLWTPDAMFDAMAFQPLNCLIGVNRVDRLENPN